MPQLELIQPAPPTSIIAKSHTYSKDGGKTFVPGVTSILRIQDALGGSDGLVRWAVGLAAKAAFEEARKPTSTEFDVALQAAIAATEEARDRGSRVHSGIEAAIADLNHDPTPRDGGLWYQWSRFLIREKPELIATEQYVIGDDYGGTYDLDAVIGGKRVLIDVKTGKYKDSFPLQLAAYGSCLWQAPAPTGTPVTPVPQFEAYYVLMLADDGYRLLEQEVGKAEIEHFRFLVRTHQQLHAWSKRGVK